MSMPTWVDSRVAIWLLSLGAVAVMAYVRLDVLGEDVTRIQQTLDDQETSLSDHVASDGHVTRGIKVAALETDQTKIQEQVQRIDHRQQKMDRNMAVICDKLGARCE